LFIATISYPYPKATACKNLLGSIPFILASFYTSTTGLAPGDKIKKIGVVVVESLNEEHNTLKKLEIESQST